MLTELLTKDADFRLKTFYRFVFLIISVFSVSPRQLYLMLVEIQLSLLTNYLPFEAHPPLSDRCCDDAEVCL